MTALTDRITAVLREYYPVSPTYSQDWAERVAERVAAELQLTEETAFRYTHLASGRSTILESTSSDVRIARKIAGDTHELSEVSRWVSAWSEVQP